MRQITYEGIRTVPNVITAQYYADVKTYIETCRKNGINEIYAMIRLFGGNPVTVKEIFSGEQSPENQQTVIATI